MELLKVVGTIFTKGEPSTIIATLPSATNETVRSGRSVDKTWEKRQEDCPLLIELTYPFYSKSISRLFIRFSLLQLL